MLAGIFLLIFIDLSDGLCGRAFTKNSLFSAEVFIADRAGFSPHRRQLYLCINDTAASAHMRNTNITVRRRITALNIIKATKMRNNVDTSCPR